MKRILRVLPLLTMLTPVLLPLKAQVTLGKSDLAYIKGEQHSFQITDPEQLITNFTPETAGAGITWDFSSPDAPFLEGSSVEYVDPSSTVFAGSVEGANMAIKTQGDDNGTYQFLNISDEGMDYLCMAMYEDGTISMSTYTPPLDVMNFPMTFGQTYEQDYLVEMTYLGELFMLDSTSISTEIDAWGTVITPAGTFTDVLRMKRTTLAKGYMYYEGNWIFTSDLSTIDYSWFKSGIHTSLVTVSRFADESGYTMIYLTNPVVTGMEESLAEGSLEGDPLSIYPNPASDVLTIDCSSGNIDFYRLFDTSGRILMQGDNCAASRLLLQTAGLSAGSYILEIGSGDLQSRKKVLVR